MIIVDTYAVNNGRKQQKQKVGYENMEVARNKIANKMNEVKQGYDNFLQKNGLGTIDMVISENKNVLTYTFTNKYIQNTDYVFKFKEENSL